MVPIDDSADWFDVDTLDATVDDNDDDNDEDDFTWSTLPRTGTVAGTEIGKVLFVDEYTAFDPSSDSSNFSFPRSRGCSLLKPLVGADEEILILFVTMVLDIERLVLPVETLDGWLPTPGLFEGNTWFKGA